ncbi:unnamed protein product [Pleuronectes platessa]|uniref:Uncharacterized protein n=1 Tax=Pleuronectes platessa TaxID=8262 RepID=A0A9N7UP03_PLEPL|nr:unnamed protein product [Pleuronectes platessa]
MEGWRKGGMKERRRGGMDDGGMEGWRKGGMKERRSGGMGDGGKEFLCLRVSVVELVPAVSGSELGYTQARVARRSVNTTGPTHSSGDGVIAERREVLLAQTGSGVTVREQMVLPKNAADKLQAQRLQQPGGDTTFHSQFNQYTRVRLSLCAELTLIGSQLDPRSSQFDKDLDLRRVTGIWTRGARHPPASSTRGG